MDDWTVDDNGNDAAADQDTNNVATTSIDSTSGQNTQTSPPESPAIASRGLNRRRGRRRPERIGEEIELYCNPFVEVYGRMSLYLGRLTRRWIEKVAGMMMGVQENFVWREILHVVDHTAW